ncbi:MAG: cation-translocating P-type ATPase [Gammaproteobacteria bacterium]
MSDADVALNDSPVQGPTCAWHHLEAAEAARRQGVDPGAGLAGREARARLQRHGENRLAEKPPRSRWLAFLDQFKSTLILVLLGAALLAGAIGDTKDAVVILIVVLFNSVLGFWQEQRAEQTLAALKGMLSPVARVRRDGRVEEIPARQLVPGDVVLLEAGDRVPADGRLLATHAVEIDEAALTGESQPVTKETGSRLPEATLLAERSNMAFMNTVVTRGRAELLVTGTGMATEMGRLSGMLAAAESGPTPLQIQLDALGRRLAAIASVVIALIFALGLARDAPLVQTILTSIALAVAAIPEGLPAVVTVTLAIGMHRMARHRAIVKRLAAVETLGCTTVICSDKTGTLTMNQMTARTVVYQGRRFSVTGQGYGAAGNIEAQEGELPDLSPLLHPAALANDSRIRDGELIGDPTEGAMLALAAKGGVDIERLMAHYPRIAELPFDSAHKFQATFHHDGDRVRLHVKGAPDVLLSLADQHLTPAGATPLDFGAREAWTAANEGLAAEAMRVLALAGKVIAVRDFDPAGDLMAHVRDLTFIGLVGIIDPPRAEARQALELCKRAGIAVKMITGDHRLTAAAIARELGLDGEVVEGSELDAMSPRALAARIERIAVFARVAPEHKVRIVQALKAHGQVVAMTGDGVNDAPALKSADIGVAMGIAGAEVTKEAATMVLTDDNFATIVRAVKEGRAIYENIVKFVRFQLSTNMGAIQTVLGASLLGWTTPFTAIQILWINIIMDGPPAMSLGVEPTRPGVMDEPPRRADARILTGARLARLFAYGLTMALGTLALFRYGQSQGETYALTLAFTTFVLFQFFNLFNARAEQNTAFNRHFFRNRWLWLSLLAVLALQALVVHWGPAQAVFRTTDLMLTDWALATLVACSVLLLDEGRKLAAPMFPGTSP